MLPSQRIRCRASAVTQCTLSTASLPASLDYLLTMQYLESATSRFSLLSGLPQIPLPDRWDMLSQLPSTVNSASMQFVYCQFNY